MTYQKAKAEVISFEYDSFVAFSGEKLDQVMTALNTQVTGCSGFSIDADAEGFHCGTYSGGKNPVTITLPDGSTVTYTWQNNGHKTSNFHTP